MAEVFNFDNLFAGNVCPVVTDAVTIAAGTGSLERGSVLGKITKTLGTPASGTNDGDAEISGVEIKSNAQIGDYRMVCIVAPSSAGANDATFAVYAPDGSRLEDAIQGTEYSNGHIKFTIGNATATDSAIGDSFTVPVMAGSGAYVLVNSANTDGSGVVECILAEDIESSAETQKAAVYLTGEFNESELVFGGTDTAAMHKAAARAKGIFFKTAVSA
ncbi:head decoration protein [Acetomicrobium sp. S15 = DSM 107314]|uniref:head decoration protein n=1 Tax=Acetomicrobium sp. S15 = DSM 107314 TaxID=2529858 RepID=UPI0018E11FDD|nr:head decoration protein [Acetomicrobium sp. S15 = DSM 107314]